MKILSWNCRGAGRAPTVKTIKALARYEGLDILFLAETKVDTPRIDSINRRLGFANFFSMDCFGRAEGLALFWKAGVDLEVVFSNNNIIAAFVYSDPPESPWLLILVYGPPYFAKRKKFWELMENLILSFSGLWLLIEDLNSTVHNSEKSGGS